MRLLLLVILITIFVVIACGTTTRVEFLAKTDEGSPCKDLPKNQRAECEKDRHEEKMAGIELTRNVLNRNVNVR